jgi:hypothetical protein
MVRGYGLVDSAKVKGVLPCEKGIKTVQPEGHTGGRTGRQRPSTIPAQYWYALMQMPPKTDFPGTVTGQRHLRQHRSQGEWIRQTSSTPTAARVAIRWADAATRTIPTSILGQFEDTRWHGTAASSPVRPAAA